MISIKARRKLWRQLYDLSTPDDAKRLAEDFYQRYPFMEALAREAETDREGLLTE